jgi:hypothetical protein
MALYFSTRDPERLLAAFKSHIEEGTVKTWGCDSDGDFTHTAPQWEARAWLRPRIEKDRLTLYILNPKDRWISTAIYAIYHGRFVESMLLHCDHLFDDVRTTAEPEERDTVSPD